VLVAIVGMALLLGGGVQAAEPIKVGAILAVTGPASFLGGPESRTLRRTLRRRSPSPSS
jgi:branched-chain amino acid transport system substrate-binding protein